MVSPVRWGVESPLTGQPVEFSRPGACVLSKACPKAQGLVTCKDSNTRLRLGHASNIGNGGRMILQAIALLLAAQGPSATDYYVPVDGKKHKVKHEGETYKVKRFGNKVWVYHVPTLAGRKRGAIIRDWNREVALLATGCSLADEYVDPMSLALEADLVCPPREAGA